MSFGGRRARLEPQARRVSQPNYVGRALRSCSLYSLLSLVLARRARAATMATFSPFPRRTARYSSIGMSPSPPRQGINKRTRAGSTQPQSRFSTPARRGGALVPVRDDDSIFSGSGMDVDEEGSEIFERGPRTETVFSKSKEMTVTFYAHLPLEVKQALRNAGASRAYHSCLGLDAYVVCRLLQGRVHGRRRSCNRFRGGCLFDHMFRLEVQSGSPFSSPMGSDLTDIT